MASKMHKIAAEISKVFGVKPKSGESDKKFAKRLHEAATAEGEEAEKKWDSLSEPAQAWVNTGTDAIEADEELPAFDEPGEKAEKNSKAKSKKDDESEDEDEDEEDDEDDKKSKSKKSGAGKSKSKKDDDDEDEEDDEDEKPAKGKKSKSKKDDDEDEDEDEDDKPAKKNAKKADKKSGAKRSGDKLSLIQKTVLDNPEDGPDDIVKKVHKVNKGISKHTIVAIRGAFIRAVNFLYADGAPPKKNPFA